MNSIQFQDQLRRHILRYFPKEQANDIVDDYRELFEAGISDGRSEEDLIASFGRPKLIARELAGNENSNRRAPSKEKIIPGVILIIVGVSMILLSNQIVFLREYPFWLFVLIPVSCLLPLPKNHNNPVSKRAKNVSTAVIAIAMVVSLMMTIYSAYTAFHILIDAFQEYPFVPGTYSFSFLVNSMITNESIALALILVSLVVVYLVEQSKIIYYVSSIFLSTLFAVMLRFSAILRSVDVYAEGYSQFIESSAYSVLAIASVGIAAAVLVVAAREFLVRRMRNG